MLSLSFKLNPENFARQNFPGRSLLGSRPDYKGKLAKANLLAALFHPVGWMDRGFEVSLTRRLPEHTLVSALLPAP